MYYISKKDYDAMINIIEIEQKIYSSIDLLEIAKDYCKFNIARDDSLCTLLSLLEIILQNQKSAIADFDKIML